MMYLHLQLVYEIILLKTKVFKDFTNKDSKVFNINLRKHSDN